MATRILPLKCIARRPKAAAQLMVLLLCLSTVSFAGQDRTLTLTNSSSMPAVQFLVSAADGKTAPFDALGGQSLAAGSSKMVTIPSATDACAYNLIVKFSNGKEKKISDVDFCNLDGFLIEN